MKKLKCTHVGFMAAVFISVGLMTTPALAIEFPMHANDLKPDERIVTGVHALGGGPQTGAKDLRILRRVADNNWRVLKAGQTNDTINSNYLIYGRPVYAMASGKVIGCWRNAPENTGHTKRPEIATGKILLQGNHLWIKQTDGNIALYAHAPTGNIPTSLCPNNAVFLTGKALGGPIWTQPEATVANGATVKAGQLLFNVGNSGNSTEPHLHMHVVNTSNAWQPMKFARGQTTPFNNNTASLNGPWTGLKGSALPLATILVWPQHPIGNWTYNGIASSAYQRVFNHFVDSGEMLNTVTCLNNGASYNTTWIPAKGSWISRHGMSIVDHAINNANYIQQGYKETWVSNCGKVAAIWRKP
jgi:Bacterial tandem repeat domain 1